MGSRIFLDKNNRFFQLKCLDKDRIFDIMGNMPSGKDNLLQATLQTILDRDIDLRFKGRLDESLWTMGFDMAREGSLSLSHSYPVMIAPEVVAEGSFDLPQSQIVFDTYENLIKQMRDATMIPNEVSGINIVKNRFEILDMEER